MTSTINFKIMNWTHIQTFLDTMPRYRLVVVNGDVPPNDFPILDIGGILAEYIERLPQIAPAELKVRVNDKLISTVQSTAQQVNTFGKAIALCNFGIVFEPLLGIDIGTVLKDLSRNILIIILWPGTIKDQKLYFLTQKSSNIIDLSDTIFCHEI